MRTKRTGAAGIALLCAAMIAMNAPLAASAMDVTSPLRTCNAPKTVSGYTSSAYPSSHNHRKDGTGAWWSSHKGTAGVHNSYGPFLRAKVWFTTGGDGYTAAWQVSCY